MAFHSVLAGRPRPTQPRAMNFQVPVAVVLTVLHLGAALDGAAEERSLAQSNCRGLSAELLAEDAQSLVALLATATGRRAARAAALRTLLGNATDARAYSLLQSARRIDLCENSWFDWLPWLACRVQSPPPRLDLQAFLDEERGGDSEGALCYTMDNEHPVT